MTPQEMDARIVRYGDLRPCKTAFIDAHTPGSDQKENFTIIGGGVSESADQHVHITDTPGFNIGAAGQPPKCRNSLHSHRTAEVFFALNLTSADAAPLSVYIGEFKTSQGLFWAQLSAAATLVVLPVLIFGWIAQRQLVRGLSFGAVK